MSGRALAKGELRSLIESERNDVLTALSKLSEADDEARKREGQRQGRFQRDVARELLKGKGIVPVVAMAQALGWTRQMTHRAIREAENA
jgi:hypothetical protein